MKFYLFLAIIELVIFAGLTGYQVYVKSTYLAVPTPTVSPIPTPTIDPLVNFTERYENQALGFAFRHPSKWTITEKTPESLVVCPSPPDYCFEIFSTSEPFNDFSVRVKNALESPLEGGSISVTPVKFIEPSNIGVREIWGIEKGSTENGTREGKRSTYTFIFKYPKNIVMFDHFDDRGSMYSVSGALATLEFLESNPTPPLATQEGWSVYVGEITYASDYSTAFSIEYPADWVVEGHKLYQHAKEEENEGTIPVIALGAGGRGITFPHNEIRTYPAGIAHYGNGEYVVNDSAYIHGYAAFNGVGATYIFEFNGVPAEKREEFEQTFDRMLSTFRVLGNVQIVDVKDVAE